MDPKQLIFFSPAFLYHMKHMDYKVLNYCMMMVKRYPNHRKEEVGSSILGCEISSLLDGRLARWLTVLCALTLAWRLSV